jgi:anti-sigma28 factor (negative regulator of flagellin synthesis)
MALSSKERRFIENKIDDIKKILTEKLEKVIKPSNEDLLRKKTESLAVISKRIEELKEKLETGQLKARESEMVAIEHRVLNETYKRLIEELLKESLNLPK